MNLENNEPPGSSLCYCKGFCARLLCARIKMAISSWQSTSVKLSSYIEHFPYEITGIILKLVNMIPLSYGKYSIYEDNLTEGYCHGEIAILILAYSNFPYEISGIILISLLFLSTSLIQKLQEIEYYFFFQISYLLIILYYHMCNIYFFRITFLFYIVV